MTKEKLFARATLLGFESTFFDNHAQADETEFFLWCCELQKWLIKNRSCYVLPYIRESSGFDLSVKIIFFSHEERTFERYLTQDFNEYADALEVGLYNATKLLKVH